MADIGSVWASGSWSTSAWAANTWADASTVVASGGDVWVWANGVSVPPNTASTGSQAFWVCVNGQWLATAPAPWPRRGRDE